MPYTGEMIAIATVVCWTISAQLFGAASKRVGSTPVNIVRIFAALVLFGAYQFFKTGNIIPCNFPERAWIYLSLSGVVGFFLGDICLFKALVELGPRLALLLFSLAAPMAAILGWAFLSDIYLPLQWIGILITLAGVGMVILEKKDPEKTNDPKINVKGIFWGLGAMLGQAVGYVLSKTGMQTQEGFLDPFAATQVRAIAAFACSALLFTLTREWGRVSMALKDKKAFTYTLTGSIIGPFLGVSLSLLVLHYLTTGVASTFLSMSPVCIIPFSIYIHKEKVSLRAFAGAVIAVAGIGLLMGS
ncbi:MAG: DMT family transporter [Desulfobacter sp.]|nr:DMT family transporter [Desulfobacter sp.]WDP84558.1 MAG: DMT family transporter [Desulfobacter sp.]